MTQAILKSLYHYNENTGIFTRTETRGCFKKGSIAGTVDKHGYVRINRKGKKWPAHRLAWLYIHGKLPFKCLDHINHNKSDNRIKNLRPADYSINNKNKSISKANTSGVIGVMYVKETNKWQAQIKINYKQLYLGQFISKSDAIEARYHAEKLYKFHENHGH